MNRRRRGGIAHDDIMELTDIFRQYMHPSSFVVDNVRHNRDWKEEFKTYLDYIMPDPAAIIQNAIHLEEQHPNLTMDDIHFHVVEDITKLYENMHLSPESEDILIDMINKNKYNRDIIERYRAHREESRKFREFLEKIANILRDRIGQPMDGFVLHAYPARAIDYPGTDAQFAYHILFEKIRLIAYHVGRDMDPIEQIWSIISSPFFGIRIQNNHLLNILNNFARRVRDIEVPIVKYLSNTLSDPEGLIREARDRNTIIGDIPFKMITDLNEIIDKIERMIRKVRMYEDPHSDKFTDRIDYILRFVKLIYNLLGDHNFYYDTIPGFKLSKRINEYRYDEGDEAFAYYILYEKLRDIYYVLSREYEDPEVTHRRQSMRNVGNLTFRRG